MIQPASLTRVAAELIEKAEGYQDQYRRLVQNIAGRAAVHLRSVDGDIDGTYAALRAAVGSVRRPDAA